MKQINAFWHVFLHDRQYEQGGFILMSTWKTLMKGWYVCLLHPLWLFIYIVIFLAIMCSLTTMNWAQDYLMMSTYQFRTKMCWWAQRKRDWTLRQRCLIHLGLVVTIHQSYLLLTSERPGRLLQPCCNAEGMWVPRYLLSVVNGNWDMRERACQGSLYSRQFPR